MAKLNVVLDTETKELIVMVNDEKVEKVMSVNVSFYPGQDEEDYKYPPSCSFRICTGNKSDDEHMSVTTEYSAYAEKKEEKVEAVDQKTKNFESFKKLFKNK